MKIGLMNFEREFQAIGQEILGELQSVMAAGKFILADEVLTFEQEFAKYCGATEAVGVASGTAALHLALVALGVQAGDEVITTSLSFNATAQAIAYCGATPVFVDVDPTNGLMDVTQVESKITAKTKAILPVHLFGMAVNLHPLQELCNAHHLALVEDCAQAHGTLYRGQHVGTFGQAGCFSFMPAKNLGAYGDAGAIITQSTKLADRLRMLRNHGRKEKYLHEFLGYAERIDNIQAAILAVKLKYLDQWNQRRQEIAHYYYQGLHSEKITCISVPPESNCTYYGFHILVKNREALIKKLADAGIETNIYYPRALPLQPVFKYLGYTAQDVPNVHTFTQHVVSLPMNPFLTTQELEYIITKVNSHV